jgi:tetratricopeptide (TPR) repeat protein
VRQDVRRCLQSRVSVGGKLQDIFSLAICCKIGFGGCNDDHQYRQLLSKVERTEEEFMKIIGCSNFAESDPREQGYYGLKDMETEIPKIDLADHYLEHGKLQEALTETLREMGDLEECLGTDLTDYVNSAIWRILAADLMNLYRAQGLLEKARYIWDLLSNVAIGIPAPRVTIKEMEAKILQHDMGETTASYLRTLETLAWAYWEHGRQAETEAIHLHLINTRKEALSKEHPKTLMTMDDLAWIYLSQGRWKEAEELDVKVLIIKNRSLRNGNPSKIANMARLSISYRNQNEWGRARECVLAAFMTTKKIFGLGHPTTRLLISELATMDKNCGWWNDAEELGILKASTMESLLDGDGRDIASIDDLIRGHERWEDPTEVASRALRWHTLVGKKKKDQDFNSLYDDDCTEGPEDDIPQMIEGHGLERQNELVSRISTSDINDVGILSQLGIDVSSEIADYGSTSEEQALQVALQEALHPDQIANSSQNCRAETLQDEGETLEGESHERQATESLQLQEEENEEVQELLYVQPWIEDSMKLPELFGYDCLGNGIEDERLPDFDPETLADINQGKVNESWVAHVATNLPERWEQNTTDGGHTYYIDHGSKSTTWEHPTKPSLSLEPTGLPQGWEEGTRYVNHSTKTKTFMHPTWPGLPPGWEQRTCYIDYNTNTVSWECPNKPDSLPPGWEEETYYIDHNTKTRTRNRPTKPDEPLPYVEPIIPHPRSRLRNPNPIEISKFLGLRQQDTKPVSPAEKNEVALPERPEEDNAPRSGVKFSIRNAVRNRLKFRT